MIADDVERRSGVGGGTRRSVAGFIVVVAVVACGRSSSVPTGAEQAAVQQDVIRTMQAMLAAEQRLDAAAVWAFHADVPGYLWADVDGKLYDFAGTKRAWADYIAGCGRITFTTKRQEVDVIGPDVVLVLWHGSADVTQKGGAVARTDTWTARYLLRRIGNSWRITGGQGSALGGPATPAKPPARVGPVKISGVMATLPNTRQYDFTSKVNGVSCRLWIAAPAMIDSGVSYPAMYILDGSELWRAAGRRGRRIPDREERRGREPHPDDVQGEGRTGLPGAQRGLLGEEPADLLRHRREVVRDP